MSRSPPFDVREYARYLNNVFGDAFQSFNQALIKSGAVIAGGSVLGTYAGFANKINDLDIYVQQSKAHLLLKVLTEHPDVVFRDSHLAPEYDQSFFRKNNINARITGLIKPTNRNRYGDRKPVPFDLMIVDDKVSVLRVVQNFDLTFCEIWYDGDKINATDPIGIRNKEGRLRTEYQNALYKEFNKFIVDRILKYMKRGFKIHCGDINLVNQSYARSNNRKVVASPEKWVVKTIIHKLLYYFDTRYMSYEQQAKFVIELKTFSLKELKILYKLHLEKPLMQKYHLSNPPRFKTVCLVAIKLDDMYAHLPDEYKQYLKDILRVTRRDEADILDCDYYSNMITEKLSLYTKTRKQSSTPDTLNVVTNKERDAFFRTHKVGKDLIMFEDVQLSEFLKHKDALVFAAGDSALCFEKDSIEQFLKNKDDNWLYECIGPYITGTNDKRMEFDVTKPYVGFPLNSEGMKGFIPVWQLQRVMINKERVYFIKPHLENGVQKMITHTASHKNVIQTGNQNFVSANHCQHGSSILVYDVYGSTTTANKSPKSKSKSKSKSSSNSLASSSISKGRSMQRLFQQRTPN